MASHSRYRLREAVFLRLSLRKTFWEFTKLDFSVWHSEISDAKKNWSIFQFTKLDFPGWHSYPTPRRIEAYFISKSDIKIRAFSLNIIWGWTLKISWEKRNSKRHTVQIHTSLIWQVKHFVVISRHITYPMLGLRCPLTGFRHVHLARQLWHAWRMASQHESYAQGSQLTLMSLPGLHQT